jgi:hypothetical protein
MGAKSQHYSMRDQNCALRRMQELYLNGALPVLNIYHEFSFLFKIN